MMYSKPNSMTTPELSVVMPCYGVGELVPKNASELISVLDGITPNYELIIVANYRDPSDPTPPAAQTFADTHPQVTCIAKQKEGGYGWDIKEGLNVVQGNYVAYIDGDGQVPFEDVARVYKAIKEKETDIAMTYRTTRGDGPWRKTISRVYNIFFLLLFPGGTVRDINAKPKIFSREAFNQIQPSSDDWFIDAEIIILARRKKLSITEIQTKFNKLEGRQSLINIGSIIEFIMNLIRFRIKEFRV